ncbi:MAG: sensor domain-containing diguanylate cyclase [Dehalococcoidia bacterium]|jgi:diguanylate cyclase (GGDEF)-like protein
MSRSNTKDQGGEPADDAADQDTIALRHQVERLRELNMLALFLHSAGTSAEIMALFLDKAPHISGAKIVYPLLLDRRRDVLHAKPLEGTNDPRLDQASLAFEAEMTQLEFPLYLRSTRRIVLEGGEVLMTSSIRDLAEDVLGRQSCESGQKKLDVKKLAMVPLVMNAEPLGLVTFMFDHEDIDVEMLELLAGHCTLALKAAVDQETAGRFGEVDEVTWLHNRRYFVDTLSEEIVRAHRYNRSLSVVLLDIDGFTAFNEGYGPSMGDRLLRSVGMTLAASLTEPEVAVRYGNDEFALILPESSRANAVALTSKLMAQVGQVTVFGGTGPPEPVTASVVIVCYPEDGVTRDELVEAAESGLAATKREKSDINSSSASSGLGWASQAV